MTFGIGPHRCPGAHFARLELEIAVEEILRRMPDLELTIDKITYRSGITRGPVELPLRFTPTSA
jgi:cytochrome P450